MICVSCAGELNSSMKHAMLSNLCPFCGQSIFTAAEADFRKSIFRILLKNGIDDDDLISRLVDDISNALRKDISPAEDMARARAGAGANRPRQAVEQQIGEEIEVGGDDDEEEDDSFLPEEARDAPSRQLTPDPNRVSAQSSAKPNNSSKVDLAMREFEKLTKQAADDGSDEDGDDGSDGDADDLERRFLASAGIDTTAAGRRPAPGGPKRPGFNGPSKKRVQ